MKGQRLAVYAGLLTTAIGFGVAGVAARTPDDGQNTSTPRRERAERDRRVEREVFVTPGDRQVIRLDGRGSQIGVLVRDPENAAEQGVTIDRVDENGAAQKAGVKEGDRVVEFDGEKVRSTRQLTRLVQETPSGRTVKMTVLRGSDRRTLDITPQADETASFDRRIGPDLEREIERGLERGLRDLPPRIEPFFDFRFDGGMPAMSGRGRLGVQVQSLNDQLAEYFGVKDGGVLVSRVTADSPAAKAGLRAGDVITKVNGEAVKDAGDLTEAIGAVKDDGAVTLDILRDKKASTVKATIEKPTNARSSRRTRPA
jgi:C-terminal processing protease CtpA/Prc